MKNIDSPNTEVLAAMKKHIVDPNIVATKIVNRKIKNWPAV
jgi:hypothetical protein